MAASLKVGKNTLWLIRASGRIIGPYFDRQIGDLLRERVLVPLDEVSRPCGRWVYLRDEPIFAKVIEEVRVQGLRNSADDSTTRNIDETQTISSSPEPDEHTAEIKELPLSPVQDVLFHSIDDLKSERAHAQAFAYDADRVAKEEAQKNSRWIWVLTIMVVLLAVGIVAFQRFVEKPIQKRDQLGAVTTEAAQDYAKGRYRQALNLYSQAYALKPSDTNIYLWLGILKIQMGDQTSEGRRLLEKLQNLSNVDEKRILTGIGIADLKDGDTQDAEASFQKALGVDPTFQPAIIDLGATALNEGELHKANDQLQLAIQSSHPDGAEFIMLAQTLAKLYKTNKNKKQMQAGILAIRDFANQSFDYALEARVAAVYLESLIGDTVNISSEVDKILDSDLNMTSEFKHNLFVYRDRVTWPHLLNWCQAVTQNSQPSPVVSAFLAMCYAKAGQYSKANGYIDNALAQAPQDTIVQSINAYLLESADMDDQAEVALKTAVANDPTGQWIQPRRLFARLCQKSGDMDCARTYWEDVLIKSNRELDALAGLANVAIEQNHIPVARKYLMTGLEMASDYKPFYALSGKLSETENHAK